MRDETAKSADKLYQPGILDAVPPVARYLLFTLTDPGDRRTGHQGGADASLAPRQRQ